VVFMSDGLLEIRREVPGEKATNAARFFRVMNQLPMELQMIVCNRIGGLGDMNVPTTRSEGAFRQLAYKYARNPNGR